MRTAFERGEGKIKRLREQRVEAWRVFNGRQVLEYNI
jgi:hypothetical protein